jgi:hypothetical protein
MKNNNIISPILKCIVHITQKPSKLSAVFLYEECYNKKKVNQRGYTICTIDEKAGIGIGTHHPCKSKMLI